MALSTVGVLDYTVRSLAERFGWTFDEYDEDGPGPMCGVCLAYDGRQRYLLQSTRLYPDHGADASWMQPSNVPDRAAALAALSLSGGGTVGLERRRIDDDVDAHVPLAPVELDAFEQRAGARETGFGSRRRASSSAGATADGARTNSARWHVIRVQHLSRRRRKPLREWGIHDRAAEPSRRDR